MGSYPTGVMKDNQHFHVLWMVCIRLWYAERIRAHHWSLLATNVGIPFFSPNMAYDQSKGENDDLMKFPNYQKLLRASLSSYFL